MKTWIFLKSWRQLQAGIWNLPIGTISPAWLKNSLKRCALNLIYIREGHSAERFAANFADEAGIHVPRVIWDATTSRVLTLERIRGVKINDLKSLDEQGTDRPWLAEYAANVFHADPHPGNHLS